MRAVATLLGIAALAASAVPASASAASAVARQPSCAEGPLQTGKTIEGTPCADVIVVPASVTLVQGGAGNDTIVGANSGPVAAVTGNCETGCHLEVGSQTFEGGPGNDVVFGDRGNDTLRGNGGNDRLYGGIGDDVLEGGEGDDWLSGGFGADKIDGQEGSDYVRGDATIDHIFDTGGSGVDTLSFSTGMTPGFTVASNPTPAANFPGSAGERGVWLKLGEGGNNALDGEPSLGGGNDEVQPGAFERIIGSPFSDYIVGGPGNEQIYGGGGADVIEGGEGNDLLNGGADGDYLKGGPGTNTIEGDPSDHCAEPSSVSCGGTSAEVHLRDTAKASVGMTTGFPGSTQLYVVGSSGADTIAANYEGSKVTVSLSGTTFNDDAGGCALSPAKTTATCTLAAPLDSVALAGMGGNDAIAAEGFPDGVTVVASGGAGSDHVSGGPEEDVLVDGEGSGVDHLEAFAGDDALTHNGGADVLDGGEGSDLFLSVALCDGERIEGGAARSGDRDNSSWARLGGVGVDARIDQGRVGEVGPGEEPVCAGDDFDTLSGIEDLEGSNQDDVLYGDGGNNQLLGHKGEDTYFALGGQDTILANSGSRDRVIDCGEGLDTAIVDFASVGDPSPIECEAVREGAVEEFKEIPLLSEPPPAEPPPPPPRPDRTPPRTRITHHPPKLVKARRLPRSVAFRFASSEPGSRFQCKLDARPWRGCASPRAFRVGRGGHAFRVAAIDVAGNRDRSPALFRFAVRRLGR
jgi:Ca2+-binding RTX toxin-like protein